MPTTIGIRERCAIGIFCTWCYAAVLRVKKGAASHRVATALTTSAQHIVRSKNSDASPKKMW